MDITLLISFGMGLLGLVIFLIIISFFSVWLRALLAQAPVSMLNLIAMRLRAVPYSMIVDARITAAKAGIKLSTDQLEAHYLAGGNVIATTEALIAADKAGMGLNFEHACAIDLATKGTGKSVIDAVRTSVNPKVIDCPNPDSGRVTIDGVAKDGIQVKVRARVTVRTNLKSFVGGAREETVVARVGESIVSTIGSSDNYKHVLENPEQISKTALKRGLDVGTAYEILSIDIADVDIGDNVGAQLQASQAEANKVMAQAQAEMRRAAAVALEQEMQAKTQEMQAQLVKAQAEVPLAMADALRTGKLGAIDWYHLKNLEADTKMREKIGQ